MEIDFECSYFDCTKADDCKYECGCISVACKYYKDCANCKNEANKCKFVCEYGRNW